MYDEFENLQYGLADFGGPAAHIEVVVKCDRQTGRPVALIYADMRDDDPRSVEALMDHIGGQFSDGWGESYEQTPFYEDYDGYRWHANFWNRDNWYLEQF